MDMWSAGVIHQDIKPANIMQTPESEYFVLDLGIARLLEDDHKKAKQQGPYKYLSPEQLNLGNKKSEMRQRSITFVSDMYSAALIALEMLTLRHFNEIWKPDERHLLSEKIRTGEITTFTNPDYMNLLAGLLEWNPSIRLQYLSSSRHAERLKAISTKPSFQPLWFLHHKVTGEQIFDQFTEENSDVKRGIVYSYDHINSVKKTTARLTDIQSHGWNLIIDPVTFKLPYTDIHHTDALKNSPYYIPSVTPSVLKSPVMSTLLVKQSLGTQAEFNPDYYVSPYFLVKDPDDSSLDTVMALYEQSVEYAHSQKFTSPVLMGLAVSYDLIRDRERLLELIDNLVLYPNCEGIFVRVELIKSNSGACADRAYLDGLKLFCEIISLTKNILIVQTDQLGIPLLAVADAAVAICPDAKIRKQDIDKKLSAADKPSFGTKKEDRKIKHYVPKLLNITHLNTELTTEEFQNLSCAEQLNCDCKYCKSSTPGIDPRENHSNECLHFMLNFGEQIDGIVQHKTKEEKLAHLVTLLDEADDLYKKIKNAGIQLSTETSEKFLRIWRATFIDS